eukprot:3094939-Rhodomonas_salina.1
MGPFLQSQRRFVPDDLPALLSREEAAVVPEDQLECKGYCPLWSYAMSSTNLRWYWLLPVLREVRYGHPLGCSVLMFAKSGTDVRWCYAKSGTDIGDSGTEKQENGALLPIQTALRKPEKVRRFCTAFLTCVLSLVLPTWAAQSVSQLTRACAFAAWPRAPGRGAGPPPAAHSRMGRCIR